MKQYLQLLNKVLTKGEYRSDRTGVGTYSLFGEQVRYDLRKGFPLLTSKKMFTKGIIHELLWFLKGDTNIKYLTDNGVHIWDAWADENGNLGPIYGKQWRKWSYFSDGYGSIFSGYEEDYIDQIYKLIHNLKTDPYSRRHIVSAWNVADIRKMALPPCHVMFQFYVNQKNELSCQLYQRSADIFLGVPFNIASYALLTFMIAHATNLKVGEFIHTMGDVHLYKNHIDQAHEQLCRKYDLYQLPQLWLNPEVKNIDDFKFEDIKILNYKSHPVIKGDIAV